jgi:hypothetical protein
MGKRADHHRRLTTSLGSAVVELASRWHGVPMRLPARQVLSYVGHLPKGVHVVMTGALEVASGDSTAPVVRLDTAIGPLVMPLPGNLDAPAKVTMTIVEDAEIVFFPRHAVLTQEELSRGLEDIAATTARGGDLDD